MIFDIYSRACEPEINLNLFLHCLSSVFFLSMSTPRFSTNRAVLLPLLALLAFHSLIHSFIFSKHLVRILRLSQGSRWGKTLSRTSITGHHSLVLSVLESYVRKSSKRGQKILKARGEKPLKLVFNEVVNHDRSGLIFLTVLPWCNEHDMAAVSNANLMTYALYPLIFPGAEQATRQRICVKLLESCIMLRIGLIANANL